MGNMPTREKILWALYQIGGDGMEKYICAFAIILACVGLYKVTSKHNLVTTLMGLED